MTLAELIQMRSDMDMLNMPIQFRFSQCSRNDPHHKPDTLVIDVHLSACPAAESILTRGDC